MIPGFRTDERTASRHAIGWMNNWTYARQLPTTDWQGGADSIVRDIRLKTVAGQARPWSRRPPAPCRLWKATAKTADSRPVTPGGAGDLPAPGSGAYRLDVTLERTQADDGAEALLKLGSGSADFATVGYNFADGTASLSRAAVVPGAEALGPVFTDRRTAAEPAPQLKRARPGERGADRLRGLFLG